MQIENIDKITPLASTIAALVVAIHRAKKENAFKVFTGFVLSEALSVKSAFDNYPEIKREFFDLDTDEGQYLSSVIKSEMGEVANQVAADDIIELLLVNVSRAKDNYNIVKNDPFIENKVIAISEMAIKGAKLIDLIHPPKINVNDT